MGIKPYLSLADIEVHLRQASQPLQLPLGIRMHHSHDVLQYQVRQATRVDCVVLWLGETPNG